MSITEARTFVGKRCAITWTDRKGQEFQNVGTIQTTKFVAMYGAYVITETAEFCMEKVKAIQPLE